MTILALPVAVLLAAEPSLVVQLEVAACGHAPPASAPLAWHREPGEGQVARLEGHGFTATVRMQPDGAVQRLSVELRYHAAAEVSREALRLRIPGPGRLLQHDLALAAIDAPARIDRGTPFLVATDSLAIVPEAGIAAILATPAGVDTGASGALEVDLILDDQASHPFAVYEKCWDRLPATDGVVDYGRLERRRPLSCRPRPADTVVRARVALYPLASARPLLPLIVERWPAGARAAVVFTDHADRTDPRALRAVLHGTSDRRAPLYGRGGFLGHGLRLTRSFFATGGEGALAEQPDSRLLASELVEAGSEVACHSVSPRADRRAAVRRGLEAFRPWHPVTWIDHEPYTNCEAVFSEGFQTSGEFAVRDLLIDAGIRWVWAPGDAGSFSEPGVFDLLGEPGPAIYPLPFDDRLWAFRSSWFFDTPARLGAALSEEALDRLEHARGLFVAHTYLGPSAGTTRTEEHRRRIAVRPDGSGALVLDPAIEAALERIGRRVRSGRVASLTWSEAGDRLRALGDVVVRYHEDGTATVDNQGSRTVRALTVSVANPGITLDRDGGDAASDGAGGVHGSADRADPGRGLGASVVFDLPAEGSVTLRARREGRAVPFLSLERRAMLGP